MDYVNVGNVTKAPFFRRLLAYLVDMVLTLLCVVFLLGLGTPWDDRMAELNNNILSITSSYQVSIDEIMGISSSVGSGSSSSVDSSVVSSISLTSEQQEAINSIVNERNQEISPYYLEWAGINFGIIASLSLVFGAIFFYVIPLFLKNGQTLGKKLLKIGVATTKGTIVSNKRLAVRYFIGQYLIETALVYALFLFILGEMALMIWLFSALMVISFPLGRSFHDLIGGTVVVDISQGSIMSEEERVEYIRQRDQQDASRIVDIHPNTKEEKEEE